MHWCFIGEITRNASLVRPVFHVRDRDGKTAIVGLYLDDESLYNPKRFVVGNTICIMYAKRKQFADGSSGIRVENGKNMKGTLSKLVSVLTVALPCTMRELFDVGSYIAGLGPQKWQQLRNNFILLRKAMRCCTYGIVIRNPILSWLLP